MTDNYTCDCSIYPLLSELMPHLGLFHLDGQLQFSLHISMKKNKQLAPRESLIISLFSFTQFSRFPVVALASQSSQVLLFFGNYLISPLSVCYEYIFHLLSILFILFFLLFFFINSLLHSALNLSSFHHLFEILFC